MFDLDLTFEYPLQPSLVKGKWWPIRFTPDRVSGEVLNVGIAFRPNRGKVHVKLLPDVKGFRTLFGRDGANNLEFALALTSELIRRTGDLVTPSPQITFGDPKPAQGINAIQILESLFDSVVTLRMDEVENQSSTAINTRTLRRNVLNTLRRLDDKLIETSMPDQPIPANIDGRTLLLDIPIWRDSDLFSQKRFGSIVSAYYADETYRQHDLDRAHRNMVTALETIAQKTPGGIFILRPPENNTAFPSHAIDRDIDAIALPLSKKVKVQICDTTEEITQEVMSFLL